jgi:hypothetical protein
MQAGNQISKPSVVAGKVFAAFQALRSANPNFEHAYDTYVQQYGKDAISVNDPVSLDQTIDPVVLVFGQTSFVQYKDSTKEISGSLGSFALRSDAYIIGRRQPQDSKLVLWNPIDNAEIELEEYNARSSVIPSRIHGAFVAMNDGSVLYTDLSSSSGTVIFGELKEGGPFVRIYDPGPEDYPRFKVERINTTRKS